jgi:hypothetical protein
VISGTIRLFFYSIAFLLVFLAAPRVNAQLHWDGNVQAGGAGRFFSGGSQGTSLAGSVGPLVAVEGDVALLPLLRAGLYVDYEYADTSEPAPPSIVSFGARAKLMIPGYRSNVHWWLFTGFGGVVLEAPGYTKYGIVGPLVGSQAADTAVAPAATGYFMEVPLGIGMGWRVRKPWEVVAELQGRFGFAKGGSYFMDDGDGAYRPATGATTNPAGVTTTSSVAAPLPTGTDVFAILLTVGIGLDE